MSADWQDKQDLVAILTVRAFLIATLSFTVLLIGVSVLVASAGRTRSCGCSSWFCPIVCFASVTVVRVLGPSRNSSVSCLVIVIIRRIGRGNQVRAVHSCADDERQ